jgi:DNA-binding SARP family transcriptional activator
MAPSSPPAHTEPDLSLCLAGEFQLIVGGQSVAVPTGLQQLLALLAVTGHPVRRSRVAAQLWPDTAEGRGLGNLRSVLWRLRRVPWPIIRTVDDRIALGSDVRVDIIDLGDLAARLLSDDARVTPDGISRLIEAWEILPDWDNEWLEVERERYRQLRLRALERVCELMIERGDARYAVEACLAAVQAEPYRESAQRALVQMHLSEGNNAAALRTYIGFRDLVIRELGIEPSPLMADLVAGIGQGRLVDTTAR